MERRRKHGYILKGPGGQQLGPMPREQVRKRLHGRQISDDWMCSHTVKPEWLPVREFLHLTQGNRRMDSSR